MTKKLTHVTHMYIMWSLHWSASANPRSVLSYVHQSRDSVTVWHVMMSWPKCSVWGGDHHCTRGRSPDSLYAALLVIRSSVKLSIAKTQDIGWGWVMPEIINSRLFTSTPVLRNQRSQTEFKQKSEKLCSFRENHCHCPSPSRIQIK